MPSEIINYKDREIIADGVKNIWVCEMGCASAYGSFMEFVEKISLATIIFEEEKVRYNSPSQGMMQFGFKGSFRVRGKLVAFKDYPRYDNPFVQAAFPLDAIEIIHGKNSLKLDLKNDIRDKVEIQDALS